MPELQDAVPEAEEYLALRRACGLGSRDIKAARAGLAGGLFAVTLRTPDGTLVGMGRIVGDGGAFAQVTDIAVHPDWQGQGLGKRVMERLMGWCQAELPASCFLSLIADPPADKLYEQFGFEYLVGMGRYLG